MGDKLDLDVNKTFDRSMASFLIILFLFLVGLIVTIFLYTGTVELMNALSSGETFFAIKLSLLTATVSTILSMIFAIPTAYSLSKFEFFGKNLVNAVLNLPIVLPPTAVGAILLIFFTTPFGTSLEEFFIEFTYTIPGLVLAQFVVVTALAIRILKPAFDDLDPEYEQVSRTLGRNKFETFFKVVLPMNRNSIVAASVLAWARSIGEFGASVTLAGATRMKTETIPIAIFLNMAEADVAQATALILLVIIISISILYFVQRITGGYKLW